MVPIAYRELWKSDRSSRFVTVVVLVDGNRRILGQPSVAPEDVLTRLEHDGFVFMHLLRRSQTRSPVGAADRAYQR